MTGLGLPQLGLLAACAEFEPPPRLPCTGPTCVDVLASARLYSAPHDGSVKLGDELAVYGDLVLVGAPSYPANDILLGTTFVTGLSLPGFGPVGTWYSEDGRFDGTGAALAIADVDGDGVVDVAVGQPSARSPDVQGVVYLLTGAPATGALDASARLAFRTPAYIGVGADVRFGAILGDPDVPVALVAGGPGSETTDDLGAVYAIDPRTTGVVGEEAALRTLRGPAPYGYTVGAWDADLDGQDDLVVAGERVGIDWFLGPWTSAATDADRDGRWAKGPATDDLGVDMETVGDVTGDGATDLGFTALTHLEPNERAGRAYVVAGGDTVERSVEELPVQVRGILIGEGMGSAIAGGDVDGDGQDDLVVGASGVYPGYVRGFVYLFRGPVGGAAGAAILDRTTADAVIEGENVLDYFGRSLAVVDDDGDAQADLVIGATGWRSGAYGGAVYLVRGADWVR